MKEPQTMNQVKERLSQFLEEIEHADPNEVDVADIDEWIHLLDQLEAKVNQLRK
ncbi:MULTISPECIES: SE1561 family protein [Staphylococcus]|uniref:Cytosolic protein n=1 Tax=Staphylococcus delphini TaxID=53344 RepID=A0AAQ0M4N0_9STAP|nr:MULTISPECIES: SE1561 family protein [Staphylococcus]MDE9752543.1 SE1561 family protein [Staphylococcus delphini]MDE9790998.1 SE1561 family protein [Staphylococcus delphini]MDE9793285.1 SE1561 family protein [Staphylococcus delphini]MDE9795745.1 SE1561 family protein [Staphylococcus delphini]MDE9797390.1 SE1561 family protein [Staphylococcus delphini]